MQNFRSSNEFYDKSFCSCEFIRVYAFISLGNGSELLQILLGSLPKLDLGFKRYIKCLLLLSLLLLFHQWYSIALINRCMYNHQKICFPYNLLHAAYPPDFAWNPNVYVLTIFIFSTHSSKYLPTANKANREECFETVSPRYSTQSSLQSHQTLKISNWQCTLILSEQINAHCTILLSQFLSWICNVFYLLALV